jgi:hypothetical protein
MSGFMEILLIIVVILAVIMLPRLLKRQEENETREPFQGFKLSGWKRLAIMASLLWPAFFALYLKPWNSGWPPFLYLAFGPVVLAWGLFWILRGFRG